MLHRAYPLRKPIIQGFPILSRPHSTIVSPPTPIPNEAQTRVSSPLSRLPTKFLLRSLLLTSLMSSKTLLRPSLAALSLLTTSNSALLNPDRNPVLNRLLRGTIYSHFCAGSNRMEVSRTISEIKNMGYQGVILGYAKEVVLDPSMTSSLPSCSSSSPGDSTDEGGYPPECDDIITKWKTGTLETLRMLGPGDFLALKLTGAGPISLTALQNRHPIPPSLSSALDEISLAAKTQDTRLWLDAEQQILQPGLDKWALELMRRYNDPSSNPLIYNTIQAYLKSSPANLRAHIRAAQTGGFSLGVKLVRGAYIEHETRALIHDSKEETDRCYDFLARCILARVVPGEEGESSIGRMESGEVSRGFPRTGLFLATHNAASVEKAIEMQRWIGAGTTGRVLLECGQIQGMADELSCRLLGEYERAVGGEEKLAEEMPRVLKCLTWGSVRECLGYLHRRAIENRGAVERTKHMGAALREELWRRVWSKPSI